MDYGYPPALEPGKSLIGHLIQGKEALKGKDTIKGMVVGLDLRPIAGGQDGVFLIVIPQGCPNSLGNRKYVLVQDVTWSSPERLVYAPDIHPDIQETHPQASGPKSETVSLQQSAEAFGLSVLASLGLSPSVVEAEGDAPQS